MNLYQKQNKKEGNIGVDIEIKKRKKFFRIIIFSGLGLAAILFLAFSGINIIKSAYLKSREAKNILLALNDIENKRQAYFDGMAQDKYGGASPRETLNMFVAALEKDDLDLAEKYFVLDYSLSRGNWKEILQREKEKGRLPYIIEKLKGAITASSQPGYASAFNFSVLDDEGEPAYDIFMVLNKQSNVWKIEGM